MLQINSHHLEFFSIRLFIKHLKFIFMVLIILYRYKYRYSQSHTVCEVCNFTVVYDAGL